MNAIAARRCHRVIATALLMLFATAALAQQTIRVAADPGAQALYRQAERLIAGGAAVQAYELLSGNSPAGTHPAIYDYLLGVAALDSGRTTEAILSLRRAAAAAPAFSAARMELARALYDAGVPGEARALFTALLDESPPARVREVITRYIASIDARPVRLTSRFTPFAELFAGYDSNANGSTDEQEFLGFALSEDNVETDSSFFEGAAGFDWIVPRSARLAWQFGARAAFRSNPDADFVDAGIVSANAGFRWHAGRMFGRVGSDGYRATRDGDANEAYGGGNLMLGRQLNDRWDVTATLRGGALRYDDAIDVLDVNRLLLSFGFSYRLGPTGRLRFEAVGGQDEEQQSGSPYGNSKTGGRISLDTAVGDSAFLFASTGTLRSDYDDLFFGVARNDTQWTSTLGLAFRDVWTDGLTIAPRLRYVDNDSDLELYVYKRLEAGIMIRWVAK